MGNPNFEGWELGIDFGTTNTRIAFRNGQGLPSPLLIGEGLTTYMPSVVSYIQDENAGWVVQYIGETAQAFQTSESGRQVSEIKTDLLELQISATDDQSDLWLIRDGLRININDVIYEILSEALNRAANMRSNTPELEGLSRRNITSIKTCLGIPVQTSLNTRKVFRGVMRQLGFSDFTIRNCWEEPALASLEFTYLEKLQDGQTVLIYDLGGGTFDTAVLEMQENSQELPTPTVLSQDGINIGGKDIDREFTQHIMARLSDEVFGVDVAELSGGLKSVEMSVLRNEVRRLKERLSDSEAGELVLQNFAGESVVTMQVDRIDLEKCVMNMGIFNNTKQVVLRAVRKAHAVKSGNIQEAVRIEHDHVHMHIDRIVVVGGATRMPWILRQIETTWGVKVVDESIIDPVTAVASGAALANAPTVNFSQVVERLPFSIELRSKLVDSEILYTAYSETVRHIANRASPLLNPYNSDTVIAPDDLNITICLVDPEEGVFGQTDLGRVPPGEISLKIDQFGTIWVEAKDQYYRMEIPNPSQHLLQIGAKKRIETRKEEQAEQDRKRVLRQVRSSPYSDVN